TRFGKNVAAGVKTAVAKRFVRVAEEQPDVLADALKEAYKGLDEQAAAMEIAAEALGIDLGATPAEKAFTDEGKHELELGEDKGEEKAVEEGPDFEAKEETEAEAEAVPAEEPEEKEAASGSDAFSTDRDNNGAPRAPQKAKAPEAQGAAEGNKTSSGAQEPTKQQYSTNNPPPQGAEKFVKEIPQSQGKSAAMSKKDFIALADAIKNMSVS